LFIIYNRGVAERLIEKATTHLLSFGVAVVDGQVSDGAVGCICLAGWMGRSLALTTEDCI